MSKKKPIFGVILNHNNMEVYTKRLDKNFFRILGPIQFTKIKKPKLDRDFTLKLF